MNPLNPKFGRWWAPLVGGIAGLAATIPFNKDPLGFWAPMIVGVLLGAGAGFVVMLAEPTVPKTYEYGSVQDDDMEARIRPSMAGNVLCLLAFLFFFMPFFPILMAGLALMLNWRVRGWVRIFSWIALILGCGMTSLFIWAWTHAR